MQGKSGTDHSRSYLPAPRHLRGPLRHPSGRRRCRRPGVARFRECRARAAATRKMRKHVSARRAAQTCSAGPARRAAPSAPAKPEARSVLDARLRCQTAVCPPGRAKRVLAAQHAQTRSRTLRVSGRSAESGATRPAFVKTGYSRLTGHADRQPDDDAGCAAGDEQDADHLRGRDLLCRGCDTSAAS